MRVSGSGRLRRAARPSAPAITTDSTDTLETDPAPRPRPRRLLRGRTPAVRHRSSCAALTSTPRPRTKSINSVSAPLAGPPHTPPLYNPPTSQRLLNTPPLHPPNLPPPP